MNGHPVGKVLSQIPMESDSEVSSSLCDRYLEDFICSRASGSQELTKVLKQTIHCVVSSLRVMSNNLLEEVAAIHVAYQMIKVEMYWFVQLSQHCPDVINEVPSAEVKVLFSGGEVLLHWDAMNCVLDKFIPTPQSLSSHQQMEEWVKKVYLIKNIAESILSSQAEGRQTHKISIVCKRKWSRIQAMHLLLQHVMIRLPSDLKSFEKRAYRVYSIIADDDVTFGDAAMLTNILTYVMKPLAIALQKHNSVPELKCAACKLKTGIDETLQFPCESKHLVCENCYDQTMRDGYPRCPQCLQHSFVSEKPFLPKPLRAKLDDYSRFQQCCRNFFIELISQICFSDLLIDKPGRDFVKQLLSIAIASDSEYHEVLFPVNEKETSEYGRKCRIIQSFLLQLLTELRPVETRELLQEFMNEGKSYVGVEQLIRDDIQLLLLCAKSSERMYFKDYLARHTLIEKMEFVTGKLKAAKKVLCNHDTFKKHRDDIDQEYIDTIAQARFGLRIAAETLHDYVYVQNTFMTLRVDQKSSVEQTIICTKDLCQQAVVKTDVTHFLIKQFVHQYGYQCFMKMSSSDQYHLKSWLLPSHTAKQTDTVGGADDSDLFLVCGSEYEDLRKKLVYSQSTITTCIEEMNVAKEALPIAAFFAMYKRLCNQVPKRSRSEDCVIKVFRDLRYQILQFELFSEEMRMSLCVSLNSTTSFEFSPRERHIESYLSQLIVHSVGVLSQCKGHPLLDVLSLPLYCPEQLQKVYLPSMPEEILDQALKLMVTETLWECPNGHKYFIGNCGQPWTTAKCPNCGAEIGGRSHTASHQTTQIEKETLKFTQYGHILGHSYKRRITADKERNLSAISQSVIRVLLHSAYFWALLHSDEVTVQIISKSVTPSVSEKDLLNYFWHHLEKDLDTLIFVLQRNEMDSSLLLHSIIHHMSTVEMDGTGIKSDKDYSCTSDISRQDWETDFSKQFIQPFTNELATKMNEAQAMVMSDDSLGMSELFRIVSEKDNMEMVDKIDVQVWSYNPTITPALIEEKLTNQDNMPYELLLEFLRKERQLRALRFLPDIIEMVTVLDEACSFRLDRRTAKSVSISTYSKDYLPVEYRQRGFDKLIKSFCEAWNSVKDSLNVPQEYKRQQSSGQSMLELFVPHKEGAGVCSLQLINFLVRLQNEMIEMSWKKADEYGTSNREYVVPLNKLQRCHVIDHAKHLEHVILSHCSYSLMAGHGTEIEYDFAALERHVLDAFLQGKPCVSPPTVPAVMYQNDVQKTSVFQVVREKVTQVPLSQQDKDEIILEVVEKHQLARTIEVVNTALGFLTVNIWSTNILLFRYAHEVLKLGENVFTSKIKRRCTVAHAISLWKVLSVQQGLTQAVSLEDPFPDVDGIFKEDLTQEDKNIINDGLRKCDQNDFLESLYEFITTYVQYLKADNEEHDFGMVERFDDISDMYKIDKIANFDEESFPSSITLSKVVSVWAHAARYYVSIKHVET